jgi:hypothetical protein
MDLQLQHNFLTSTHKLTAHPFAQEVHPMFSDAFARVIEKPGVDGPAFTRVNNGPIKRQFAITVPKQREMSDARSAPKYSR